MPTQDQVTRFKAAGYTHWIEWEEPHSFFGTVKKSFPSTPESIERYIRNLKARGFEATATEL